MHTIQLKSYIGSDRLLQISLPNVQNTELEIILIYHPTQSLYKRQWSSDFSSVFGASEAVPLVRAEQEEPSERESL